MTAKYLILNQQMSLDNRSVYITKRRLDQTHLKIKRYKG